MKMKIWIEEAMKEMVEEVEKNEPMPKHWKRNVLLFCLLSAVCFQTGLWVLAKNGIASADRSPLFIAIGIVCSMLVGVVLYNPQIQISAESETKRSIFREKDKTKRSKKESAQHSKSRNKSFVMTSVSAL